MKKIMFTCAAFLSLSLLSGCGPDFGDQILRWVRNNARSYSEKLTRADLSVRWLNQFNETYRTIAYYQERADGQLHRVSQSTTSLLQAPALNLKQILDVQERSRKNMDALITMQHTLQDTRALFGDLDSIGSLHQFEQAGLRAVGKETLMRSFMEVGDVQEEINRLRYWSLFNFKYSISVNTETGEVTHEAGEDNSAQTYSGSFEGWLASFPLTAPFYAVFMKDKIEEQIDQIKEAIDLFDELSLKPAEQYVISKYYVDSARTHFRTFHAQSDSIFREQQKAWKMLYTLNVTLNNEMAVRLAPYKREAAEGEIGGRSEINRVLSEEQQQQTKTDVINMTEELLELKKQSLKQTSPLTRLETGETFLDACVEAEYVVQALQEKLEYRALYPFLQKYHKRIAVLRTEAQKIIDGTYP